MSRITGISPRTGSSLGGTLLFIDGENFSSTETDHVVMVGESLCEMVKSSLVQIQCRIEEIAISRSYEAEVTVKVGKSEFAISSVERSYSYQSPISTITGLSTSFDEDEEYHIVTVSGTRFPTEESNLFLYVDNVLMDTVSASETKAVFAITTMLDYESTNVKMMTDDGLPLAYESYSSFTLDPVLLSIEPQIGSAAGTFLTVRGSGFGTEAIRNLFYKVTTTEFGFTIF